MGFMCWLTVFYNFVYSSLNLQEVNVQQLFLKIRFICCHETRSSQSLAFFSFFLAVHFAEMTSTVCNALSLHLAHLTWSLCVSPPTERLQVQRSSLERCFANHNQQMWEAEENCWLFEGGWVSQASFSRVTFSKAMPLFIKVSVFSFTDRDDECLVVENSSQISVKSLCLLYLATV